MTTEHGRLTEKRLHAIFRSAFRRRKGLLVGPGEDCARIRPPAGATLLSTVDQLVEGVHFRPRASPARIARKLFGRCLSDVAAAGGRPWAASLTLAAGRRRSGRSLARLAEALVAESTLRALPLVGGDCTQLPSGLALSLTILALEGRRGAPGRGGAKAGDLLVVTGRLGGAVRSGRHLSPQPRLAEGVTLNEQYHAHAMLDLSDGLATDLPRLLEASGVGATVDCSALPLAPGLSNDANGYRAALTEGEDYELLAALSPRAAERAFADRRLQRTGLTVIGRCHAQRDLRWKIGHRRWTVGEVGWEPSWR